MPTSESRKPWVFAFVGMLALLAHLAVSLEYSNWHWGFNHYYFFPSGWNLVAVGLGCVLCLPWVWSRLLRARLWDTGRGGKPYRRALAVHVGIAALACVVFWFLRTSSYFLGDGALLIRLLDDGSWFHAFEPLDRAVHQAVYRIGHASLGWTPMMTYAVVSVTAGSAYVLAALRLGRMVGKELFVPAFLLTLGSVQLFLGYAESYSLATVAILIYMVVSIEHCEGTRRLIWPAVTLTIGIALHHSLMFLLPSFAYLYWSARRQEPSGYTRTLLQGAGDAALVLAPLLVTATHWETGGVALPYVPFFEHKIAQYTMFSWEHVVDFMNEQVLLSPLAWVVAVAFAVAFWRGTELRQSRRFVFLIVASSSGLLFGFLIRPGLGGSRDWDLWSLGSMPYLVAVACWVAWQARGKRWMRHAAAVLVVVNLFHVIPWVAINRSMELGVERFELMLKDNPLWTGKRIAAGHEALAGHYAKRDDTEKVAEHLEQAVALVPRKSRYWADLGTTYLMLDRYDEAEKPLLEAVRLDPNDAKAYSNLGGLYLLKDRHSEAEQVLKLSIGINPDRSVPHYYLGTLYRTQGRIEEAAKAFRRATDRGPGVVRYWHDLAVALDEIPGRESEATEAWRRVADLARQDPKLKQLEEKARSRIQARK